MLNVSQRIAVHQVVNNTTSLTSETLTCQPECFKYAKGAPT